MSNAAVNINNLTTGYLSIDVKIAPKKIIRARLAPVGQTGASVDVGDIATVEDLNSNPQFRAYMDATVGGVLTPKLSVTVVRGTNDVNGAVDFVANSTGLGMPMRKTLAMAAGGAAGTADDVTVYAANFPFAARLTGVTLKVSTAVALSTCTLRTAAAGAGSVLSGAIPSDTAGTIFDTVTASGTMYSVAAGGSIYVRRADRSMVGTIIIDFERTA